jgi:hypothetical protein
MVASYRWRPLRRFELLALLLLGALAVFLPLAYGYLRMQYAATNYGPAAAQAWSQPWYALSGAAVLCALILFLLRWMASRRRVAVHQRGLVLAASRKKFIPWSELEGVAFGSTQTHFLGIPLRNRQTARLYPAVGKPIRLPDSVENMAELLTRIKAALYPRLLPRMQAAFEAGKTLYFGSLAITQSNLRLAGEEPMRSLPWEQIAHIGVQSGMLEIHLTSEEKIRMPVQDIPNLELLLQIIQSGVKK